MIMTISKKRNVQSDGYAFQVPNDVLNHVSTRKERDELASSIKRFVFNDIYKAIKLTKEAKTSILAENIMRTFIYCLNNGYLLGVNFKLENIATRLENAFSRIPINGSKGFWRYSDIFDNNICSDTVTSDNPFSPFSDVDSVMGIQLSNSSLEAKNKETKQQRGRLKNLVIDMCRSQQIFMHNDSVNESEVCGLSFMALPYGGGGAHPRASTKIFKKELTDGMAFTGRLSTDIEADQRELYVFLQETNRVYLFNTRRHVNAFKLKLRNFLNRRPTKDELKSEFKRYIRRYDTLKKINTDQFENEVKELIKKSIVNNGNNNLNNVSDIPQNYEQTNPKDWFSTKLSVLKQLHEEMRSVVMVKSIETDLSYADICRHEKFRITMESDKKYIFKWTCTCESALSKGFCGHIFLESITLTGEVSNQFLRVVGTIL